jgi:hypothetical protein
MGIIKHILSHQTGYWSTAHGKERSTMSALARCPLGNLNESESVSASEGESIFANYKRDEHGLGGINTSFDWFSMSSQLHPLGYESNTAKLSSGHHLRYVDGHPPQGTAPIVTALLIHGFPDSALV